MLIFAVCVCACAHADTHTHVCDDVRKGYWKQLPNMKIFRSPMACHLWILGFALIGQIKTAL